LVFLFRVEELTQKEKKRGERYLVEIFYIILLKKTIDTQITRRRRRSNMFIKFAIKFSPENLAIFTIMPTHDMLSNC